MVKKAQANSKNKAQDSVKNESVKIKNVDKLTYSFKFLEEEHEKEEYFWTITSFSMFFALFFIFYMPIINYIFDNKKIDDFLQILLIPLTILLFSSLLFTLVQYSKAKNLRIENQKKVAVLHLFEGIKAVDSKEKMDKGKLYDKIIDSVLASTFDSKKNTTINKK